jgi:hypothetical protein
MMFFPDAAGTVRGNRPVGMLAARCRRRIAIICALSLVGLVGRPTSAQLATRGRVPVAIALVSDLPSASESDVGLIRRSPIGADTILLRRDKADGASLANAVIHLLATRQLIGPAVAKPVSVRLPSTSIASALAHREVNRAEKVVRRLRLSTPQIVQGLGIAQVTTISVMDRPILTSALRRRSGAEAHLP